MKNGKRAPKGVRNSCLGEPCRAGTLGEGLPYIQVLHSRYLLFSQAVLTRRRSKDEMGVPDASMGMDGYEQNIPRYIIERVVICRAPHGWLMG
jgi:hypothetical protein